MEDGHVEIGRGRDDEAIRDADEDVLGAGEVHLGGRAKQRYGRHEAGQDGECHGERCQLAAAHEEFVGGHFLGADKRVVDANCRRNQEHATEHQVIPHRESANQRQLRPRAATALRRLDVFITRLGIMFTRGVMRRTDAGGGREGKLFLTVCVLRNVLYTALRKKKLYQSPSIFKHSGFTEASFVVDRVVGQRKR